MHIFTKDMVTVAKRTSILKTAMKFCSHHTLIFLFVLRILNIILVQTWFVPDEYWQSLEVAHKLVFKYGCLTWEWNKGIRSYFHPFIFAVVYYVIKITGFSDFTKALIYGPRLVQAIASAVAEWSFYKFVHKQFGANVALWFLFSLSTSWFWWYCATRTLINSVEAVFVCISFYFFPCHEPYYGKRFKIFLMLCITTVYIRPSSIALWIPMSFAFLFQFSCRHSWLNVVILVFKSGLAAGFVFFIFLLIDSYCYGRWVSIHYNFLLFNVIKNQGTFYGSHSWHWYLSQGVPTVIGTHLPFAIHGSVQCLKSKQISKFQFKLLCLIWFLIGFTIFLYSIPGHKEFRFLLLILPLFMLFSGLSLSFLPEAQRNCGVVFIFITNVIIMLYTGLYHQSAPLNVINHIRNQLDNVKLHPSGVQVLFLLPCHSTPYYSHLHRNVSMRFLTCEPDLTDQGPQYIDEADRFFADPISWLEVNLFSLNKHGVPMHCPPHLPTFIVLYDCLEAQIGHALSICFKLNYRSFHTHFPSGRVGHNMLVLIKK